MSLRSLPLASLALALALPVLAGCGDEDPPPAFIIRAISNDVALEAAELVQLRATPREGTFRDEPVGDFLPGLSSRIEGETWIVEANAGFVAANQATPPPNTLWAVDIPVYTTQAGQPVAMTPVLTAAIRRGGEEIATSGEAAADTFLPIPLEPADGPLTIRIQCKTVPGPGGVPMPLPQCASPTE